ncbi:MAG: EamA family transporter [Candidatus Nanoarchaeia archaeon]
MEWLIFALLAAFLVTLSSLTEKKVLFKEHAMRFATVLAIINMLISLPLFIFIDYNNVPIAGIIILFFTGLIGAVAFLMVAKAMRHMEISTAAPYFTLGPLFTVVFAWIFLDEILTVQQMSGISLILLGSYALQLKGHELIEPFRNIKNSKYIHFLFFAAILYGISSTFDRALMANFGMEPLTYIAFIHLFIAIHMFIMISILHDGVMDIKEGFKKTGFWVFLVSLFLVTARYSQITAIKMAYVAPVISVKRLSILFIVLIGGTIFNEQNIIKKSVFSVLMIIGTILLVI